MKIYIPMALRCFLNIFEIKTEDVEIFGWKPKKVFSRYLGFLTFYLITFLVLIIAALLFPFHLVLNLMGRKGFFVCVEDKGEINEEIFIIGRESFMPID